MGQGKSTPQTDRDRRNEQHMQEKAPIEVVVAKPKTTQKPIIKIPGTAVRVLHVDPTQRKDVVPEHGYVALEYIPSWRRRTGSNADTSLKRSRIDASGSASGEFGSEESGAAGDDKPRKHKARLEEDSDAAPPPTLDLTARGEASSGAAFGGMSDEDPFSEGPDKKKGPPRLSLLQASQGDPFDEVHSEAGSINSQSQVRSSVSGRQVGFKDAGAGYERGSDGNIQLMAVPRKFVRPIGHALSDRVFFEDQKRPTDVEFQPSLNSKVYELEEDEVHEMAGVPRVGRAGTANRKKGEEDPFATYEVKSDVLNALHMALEAPMKDFRIESVAPTQDEDAVAVFRREAMEKAQTLFRAAEEETAELARTVGGLRAPGSARHLPSFRSGGESDPMGRSSNPSEGVELSPEEQERLRKEKIKRRKFLHKELDNWKEQFQESFGRPATAIELSNDPSIREIYREYIALKKETSSKAGGDEETVIPTLAPGATVADTLVDTKASFNLTIGLAQGTTGKDSTTNLMANMFRGGERATSISPAASPMPYASSVNQLSLSATPRLAALSPHQEALVGLGIAVAMPFDGVSGVSPDSQRGGSVNAASRKSTSMNASVSKEEKKEMKALAKEVKAWKINFKKETGRNPTRREISTDPSIAEQYLRLKELKALDGGGDGEDDDQAHEEQGPTLSLEEIQQLLIQLQSEETIERRNLAADEEFDRRALVRRKSAAPSPRRSRVVVAEEVDSTSPEPGSGPSNGQAVQGQTEEGGAFTSEVSGVLLADGTTHLEPNQYASIAKMKRARASQPGWGTSEDTQGLLRRRGSIVRALKDWQQDHVERFGKGPSLEDLQQDPHSLEMYQELERLPKDGDNPELDFVLKPNSAQGGMSHADAKALAKRRKDLGKELNAWKAQFAIAHQREPTTKDIRADPQIAPIFEEYSSIPKDIGKQVTTEAAAAPDGVSEMLNPNAQAGAASTASLSAGLFTTGGSSTGLLTDADIKKRKKEVGKELNAWKSKFAEENGREPTIKDIKNSEIGPLYEEYRQLGKAAEPTEAASVPEGLASAAPSSTELRGDIPAVSPAPGAAIGGGAAKLQQKRRKALGRELNAWKAKFASENGRQPTTKDMKKDPSISAIYEEYASIPKDASDGAATVGFDGTMANFNGTMANLNGTMFSLNATGGLNDTTTQSHAPSITVVEEPPPAVMNIPQLQVDEAQGVESAALKNKKKRKKALGKELNSWKSDFFEATGQKARTDDIKNDPQIAPLYEEYMSLSKEIDQLSAGGGEAGQEDATLRPSSATVNDAGSLSPQPTGSAEAGVTPDAFLRPPSSSKAQSKSPTEDPEEKDASRRRKELTRMLNGWKAEFAEKNGRTPTNKDIKKDPEAAALFEEYSQLKAEKKSRSREGEGEGEGEDAAPSSRMPEADIKENIENNTPPNQRDSDGGERDPPPAGGTPTDEAPRPSTAERKALKKQLTRELNAWKEQFAQENGRNPKASDIQQFPEVNELYRQLQLLKEEA